MLNHDKQGVSYVALYDSSTLTAYILEYVHIYQRMLKEDKLSSYNKYV